MNEISDEYMQQLLQTIKPYCMVLLRAGPNAGAENVQSIVWEHGRRNFLLREQGKVAIVCPVTKEADVAGLYLFNTDEEEAERIMTEDPAVVAGIFSYQTYPCMSFPGDKLG